MRSVLDVFTIGIGPSSSHTVGPMRAARRFVLDLETAQVLTDVDAITVDLYGSLAQNAKCHNTLRAILLGLLGEVPEQVDPAAIEAKLSEVFERKYIRLLGKHPIAFDLEYDLARRGNEIPFRHRNAMRFSAYDWGKQTLASRLFYSVGGGLVLADGERMDTHEIGITENLPYPYKSPADLLQLGNQYQKPIWEIVLENEKVFRAEEEIEERIFRIWQTMQECVYHGLQTSSMLPGGLGVQRQAPRLYEDLLAGTTGDPFSMTDWVNVFATAVTEENAAGRRVVAAPTNGAAGVIPAVALYYHEFVEGAKIDGLFRLILTAGAIGALYKHNDSISRAETGCQGEVGVACSMAAGGLVAALAGTNEQVDHAAAIAMEYYLGMPCDPVDGFVQIPCIERNGLGAINAVNAAQMSMDNKCERENKRTLDQMVSTMRAATPDVHKSRIEQWNSLVNVVQC